MNIEFEQLGKLMGLWRWIVVLGGMVVLFFSLIIWFNLVPTSKHEKWQVPCVGLLVFGMGLCWLSNQPPSKPLESLEVVPQGTGAWKEKPVVDAHHAWAAQNPALGIIVLVRIPKLGQAISGRQFSLQPKTKIMQIKAAKLFGFTEGKSMPVIDGIADSTGMKFACEAWADDATADGFVLFAYQDKPAPSNEQLTHLIQIK